MAGDWMKIELDLADKPEIHYIANTLSLDPDTVIGKLIRVWAWFDKHTTDGNAHGVTFALIDRLVTHAGFGEAMQFAGWLAQKGTVLSVPKFTRHNGQSAKKRALTERRVQKLRNAASVTKTLPEKRREENIKSFEALPPKAVSKYRDYTGIATDSQHPLKPPGWLKQAVAEAKSKAG